MKKLLFAVAILGGSCFSAIAQDKTTKQVKSPEQVQFETTQMEAIQNCSELQKQLVSKFGKNYSINDPKVIEQLGKNGQMKDRSNCVAKISAYVLKNKAEFNAASK